VNDFFIFVAIHYLAWYAMICDNRKNYLVIHRNTSLTLYLKILQLICQTFIMWHLFSKA